MRARTDCCVDGPLPTCGRISVAYGEAIGCGGGGFCVAGHRPSVLTE
jgi:hypothetical protein